MLKTPPPQPAHTPSVLSSHISLVCGYHKHSCHAGAHEHVCPHQLGSVQYTASNRGSGTFSHNGFTQNFGVQVHFLQLFCKQIFLKAWLAPSLSLTPAPQPLPECLVLPEARQRIWQRPAYRCINAHPTDLCHFNQRLQVHTETTWCHSKAFLTLETT